MIIVMSARHQNVILLVLFATAGSALGGYFSYQVGQRGGMAFLKSVSLSASSSAYATGWRTTPSSLSLCPPYFLHPCR